MGMVNADVDGVEDLQCVKAILVLLVTFLRKTGTQRRSRASCGRRRMSMGRVIFKRVNSSCR